MAKSKSKNEEFQGNGGGEGGRKSKNDRSPSIVNADFGHFSKFFRRQTRQKLFLENLWKI